MQRIKRMKDKLIEEAQSRLQNMDGGSIEQMGQIIDMIKDLSEAEKSCLEAEYYDSVIDAMENGQRYGYDGQGGNAGGRQGYCTVMSSSELTTRPEICGTMRAGICWYCGW